MLGLAVLFVMAIYFMILFLVIRFCYKKAINKGKTKKIAFLFGLLGFSLVFLPVFWDYIPNRIYFNYLCKNDTQLQVYKTFEEWNTENPDVLETLTPFSYEERDEKIKTDPNYRNRSFDGITYEVRFANQRILFYWSKPLSQKLALQIKRSSYLLFDIKSNQVIAKIDKISSGPGNVLELGGKGYKIWLNDECQHNNYKLISRFARQFNVFRD
ncbi:hypothetical protein [Wohlfahrtiimonas populi]|uniref:hypothetical protein n=1 Tax=Wohlfahrtiimonas populi TaxID=1940240 RepID=UPI00098D3252|nr:hypothetical protein [Wohlfahrtiimonas populi]